MVDIHDRRPVVLEPEDALRWMNPDTPVEEAAHIAQARSIPTEEFVWWKVDRAVNRVDPNNNGPPSADAHKRVYLRQPLFLSLLYFCAHYRVLQRRTSLESPVILILLLSVDVDRNTGENSKDLRSGRQRNDIFEYNVYPIALPVQCQPSAEEETEAATEEEESKPVQARSAASLSRSRRGTSAFKARIVNSYAVARPRAIKPIKPRPNNSIAYISGSGTTVTATSCPWLLMAVALPK